LILGNECGWDEIFGGGGLYSGVNLGSGRLMLYQDSNIRVYLLGLYLWLVLFLFV